MYAEDDLLMLSGIQHFAFCKRQWALIHLEQTWSENRLTVEGHHLHERVDDPFENTKRNQVITCRSISVASFRLGLYGIADVVEFHSCETEDNSIVLPNRSGFWRPIPVEYKRGKPKPDERDEVQLCAQAICLEEMYNLFISNGYLYYGETRHRSNVDFTSGIRLLVEQYAEEMHRLFQEKATPLPEYKSHCKSCSLINECIPKQRSRWKSVRHYLSTLED